MSDWVIKLFVLFVNKKIVIYQCKLMFSKPYCLLTTFLTKWSGFDFKRYLNILWAIFCLLWGFWHYRRRRKCAFQYQKNASEIAIAQKCLDVFSYIILILVSKSKIHKNLQCCDVHRSLFLSVCLRNRLQFFSNVFLFIYFTTPPLFYGPPKK